MSNPIVNYRRALPVAPCETSAGDLAFLPLDADGKVAVSFTGDVQIGSVEIKDATTDTRAVVGANGLYADIRNIQAGTAIIGKVGIDQTTDGTTNKVQARNATNDNFATNATLQIADVDVAVGVPVPVQSPGFESSASQTRPANTTAYTAGDVVGTDAATNLSFANIGNIAGGCFEIQRVSLRVDVSAVPAGMSTFKLHLFNAAPTAITDNLAFNLIAADRAKYLGYITIYQPEDFGDTLWGQDDKVLFKGKLAAASTTLYGVLQTTAGYTPASETVKTISIGGTQC